jgi:hypothetical protein
LEKLLYIPSLHRPFSQQLKATKWVCEYLAANNKRMSSSNLNLNFYYYLINRLHNEYKKGTPSEFNGLPSDLAVTNIYQYLKTKSKKQFIEEIPNIIKSRNTPLERQIYSTYKAASYYVNLAKDKFYLIDDKNKLTEDGKYILTLKSSFFKISTNEKKFFFKKILNVDFHLFVTHCLFSKLEKQYSLKNTVDDQMVFIDKFLKIGHFNFTSSSLENYNIVRSYWTDTLDVIDANGNIRKKYIAIITENEYYKGLFQTLLLQFSKFEKENFKLKKNYLSKKNKFLESYKNNFKDYVTDLGYLNLYDIKEHMRISNENFQSFLAEFYELEKNNLSIFFSNDVNSIDRRERFLIRNRPVIKIKIK